ncbi:Protein C34E7.4 [Aphelenchoides avenae]|nr:Protein C34E7.4 [Aphelenchus avenae]
MGGQVEVPKGLDGSKKYYVHVETRLGFNGKPMKCSHADKDGCGGLGSCVYCDICDIARQPNVQKIVQLYRKDCPYQCDPQGLDAGVYDDVSLKICIPTKEQLLPFFDPDRHKAESIWDAHIKNPSAIGKVELMLAARVFDRPINNLTMKGLNDALYGSKEGMIGCHWIQAVIVAD